MPMSDKTLCVVCKKNNAIDGHVCWKCRVPQNLIKSFYDDDTIEWNEELGYRALLLAVAYVGTPKFQEMFDRQIDRCSKKWVPKKYESSEGLTSSQDLCSILNVDKNTLFRYIYKNKMKGTRVKRQYFYTEEQKNKLMEEIQNAPPKKVYKKRNKNLAPLLDEAV